MVKRFLLATAVLFVAGIATVVWAQQGPPPPSGPTSTRDPMARQKAVQEYLGLSDQQVGDLRKLRQDSRKSTIPLRADTKVARLELAELLAASTIDEEAVAAKSKVLFDLMAQVGTLRIDGAVAARKIMSVDQWTKVLTMRRTMGSGQGGRGGRGMHGGGRGMRGGGRGMHGGGGRGMRDRGR